MQTYIYEFRGVKVILDSDLADLYECKNGTKEINQIVKNNYYLFLETNTFILTNEESDNLMVILNDQNRVINKRGGKYKNPRVFTKEGILIISSLLKSNKVLKVNKELIPLFDKDDLMLKSLVNIRNLIYEVRGKQVMLDIDLADLYECKNGTKSINLAVKRNIERFPKRYMFQLTEEEFSNLRFQNETSSYENYTHGGRRYLPYAFTEQGVAMLATVLKTSVAVITSINIMDTFVSLRHYIGNNEYRMANIEAKIIEHDKEINILQETFFEMNKKQKINSIFFEGQIYDAYSLLIEILNKSKEEIIIIDNYAGKELLDILKDINKNIIIVSKNIDEKLRTKYLSQYDNILFINNNSFHDRFIIIDRKILYSCGCSFKDLGKKCFGIHLIEEDSLIKQVLDEISPTL